MQGAVDFTLKEVMILIRQGELRSWYCVQKKLRDQNVNVSGWLVVWDRGWKFVYRVGEMKEIYTLWMHFLVEHRKILSIIEDMQYCS